MWFELCYVYILFVVFCRNGLYDVYDEELLLSMIILNCFELL